ncbi:unnamed protein product [Protopolystoma xenopodis]|uniref:Uncharacterized protein n=1 Tax=Protopolystoma xenopodis TaxID=117903 RepID=A0A3S5BA02_9PLAT|nr:unnamed protein product [Protopolystoma xenopodis]
MQGHESVYRNKALQLGSPALLKISLSSPSVMEEMHRGGRTPTCPLSGKDVDKTEDIQEPKGVCGSGTFHTR